MDIVELMREYVRVADMCKRTDVKPWECVKLNGHINLTGRHPSFDRNAEYYTFAISILEGRPVFNDSVLYGKTTGNKYQAKDIPLDFMIGYATWTPPTKTRMFMLNGVELPCPVVTRGRIQSKRHIRSIEFEFDSAEEGDTFITRLNNLLTEARDKE